MPKSVKAACGRSSAAAARTANHLLEAGDASGAVRCVRHALHLSPGSPQLAIGLADLLSQFGRFEESAAEYEGALRILPSAAEIYYNLGQTIGRQEQDMGAAQSAFEAAQALAPEFVENLHSLGVTLSIAGEHARAGEMLRRALRLRPSLVSAHFDLALVYQQLKQPQKALANYDAYFAERDSSDLQYLQARANRAGALDDLGRTEEAVSAYEAVLQLAPVFPEVYANLATLHNRGRSVDGALAALAAGRAVAPAYSPVHLNLGLTLKRNDRHLEAAEAFSEALRLAPEGSDDTLCFATLARKRVSDWRGWEMLIWQAQRSWRAGLGYNAWDPLYGLSLPQMRLPVVRQLAIDRSARLAIETNNRLQGPWRSDWVRADAAAGLETLRVGYVSADFGMTAVGGTTRSFFARHARQPDAHFDVHAFSLKATDESSLFRSTLQAVDPALATFQVRDEAGGVTYLPTGQAVREGMARLTGDAHPPRRFIDLSAADTLHVAAAPIAAVQLHVLVDFNGYTEGERADLLTLRLAPVTMHAIGYPATMGAEFAQYMLMDRQAAPPAPNVRLAVAERLVLLPHCYLVNGHSDAFGEVVAVPGVDGPSRHKLVIINFNQLYKLEPRTMHLWCGLLGSTGGRAILWLRSQFETGPQASILREATACGMRRGGIVFADYDYDEHAHISRVSEAQLSLDTPEYNGHTTGNDMLWAGVPLVSVPGEHPTARMGRSLLGASGASPTAVHSLRYFQGLAHALAVSLRPPPALLRVDHASQLRAAAERPRARSRRRIRAQAFPLVAELQTDYLQHIDVVQ